MIIPRYSLRWLLALITVCGGLSMVLAYAVQGQPWAIGASVGFAALALVVSLHAAAFSIAWLMTQFAYTIFGGAGPKSGGASPFGQSPFVPTPRPDPEPPAIMS
jgi:hypothetical protein